jgi:hypothetical protein
MMNPKIKAHMKAPTKMLSTVPVFIEKAGHGNKKRR